MLSLSIRRCMVLGLVLAAMPLMVKAGEIKVTDERCMRSDDASRVFIPEHLVGNPVVTATIDDLVTRVDDNRVLYFAKMAETPPFFGLYFRGDADRSLTNDSTRSSYALEWELLKQGLMESRRKLGKASLERRAQYYQLLRDMEERQLQAQKFRIQQIRNKVSAFLYGKEVAALQPLLERRQKAAAGGFVTRDDVADIKFKVSRAMLKQADYQSVDHPAALTPTEYALINQIESLELQPIKELVDRAIAHSYEYELQILLAKSSEDYPAWTESTSLKLYLEKSREVNRGGTSLVRIGTYDATTVGMRVQIPLGYDSKRDEIVGIEQRAYMDQQQAVALRLEQRVAVLADRLIMRQSDLRVLFEENKMLREQTERSCYQLNFPTSNLESSPDRKLDNLLIQMSENRRAILFARLDIFELMAELGTLIKPEQPGELYQMR